MAYKWFMVVRSIRSARIRYLGGIILQVEPSRLEGNHGKILGGLRADLLAQQNGHLPWATVDQLLILGMGDLQPLIGNPYNGYINLYYWVDDHLQLQGTNGSLDPSTHGGPQNDGLEKVMGPFKHGNLLVSIR